MERLTKRNSGGTAYYPTCIRMCGRIPDANGCLSCYFRHKRDNLLAEYEDTGLTPKEIMELKSRMEGLDGQTAQA